ncbi:sensor histidine kinase [Aureibacter tunicatorum]|uniref:histidine kinase n=1 Tax=Aureibacter tunicatorum TaxID=866807 RepID=A0AAE4BRJ6_9BACT|nr:ATP-binding protein [Aureibacter tunicatorum]MDR6237880.1 nitrogen fixation/metabolism regulation signal transduction histidine kinase [Aureibacter tunicatorum]BDD02915.1 sensor histidine kinase [Aureibacter tunicatorum]
MKLNLLKLAFTFILIAGLHAFIPKYLGGYGLIGIAVFDVFFLLYLLHKYETYNEAIICALESLINDDFSIHAQKSSGISSELIKKLEQLQLKFKSQHDETAKQTEYFRFLIENINIGILTYKDNWKIVHSNKRFKEQVGVGQLSHIRQLFNSNSEWKEALEKAKTWKKFLFESHQQHRKAKYLIQSSTVAIKNDEYTFVSVHDIEHELEYQELESWNKLFQVLTHEIMNTLTPITSLSESLSELVNNSDIEPVSKIPTLQRGLEIIKGQSDHLMHFVKLYRGFIELPKPKKKDINIAELIHKSIHSAKENNCFDNTKISIKIYPKEFLISVDEGLMTQTLTNILKNAWEAKDEHRTLEINIDAHQNNSGVLVLFVCNNGRKIPPEALKNIFVPFFTTKDNGNGIGLSLSKQIVNLHGGKISVSSTEEKTCFKIEI